MSPARVLLQIQAAVLAAFGLIAWALVPDAALDEARLAVLAAAIGLVCSALLGIGWGLVRIPVMAAEVAIGALGVILIINAVTADVVPATYRGVLGAGGVAVVASAVAVLIGASRPLIQPSGRPEGASDVGRQARRTLLANVAAIGVLALAASGAEAVRSSPERAFRRELDFSCARVQLDLGKDPGDDRIAEFNRLADALVRLDHGIADLEPPESLEDGWDQAQDGAASAAAASSALRDPGVVGDVDERAIKVTAEVLGRLDPLRTYAERNDIGRCRRF